MRVLALDVGSSSVRACAYDERGRESGPGAQWTYSAHLGRDGSAEFDPDELLAAARAALEGAGEGHDALGISCFMHSLLLLDERDRPLTPVLLWQDRRAVGQAEELAERLDERAVHARTGCAFHPSFWPAKLAWLRSEGLLEKARHAVSFADYLFLALTGELHTTLSTASGSGLLDLRARRWDEQLLGELGVDEALLPPLGDDPAGTTYPPLADGPCSNLGAGCTSADRAALNIGTSGALRIVHEGERSPGWNPRATGAIAGLTFETDAADLLQAGLEGVAYRIAESADRLPEVREVVATGHALLASPEWTQLFADVLGLPVTASRVAEGSARGAAVHVLERLGIEPEPAPLGRAHEPDPERTEIYAAARERQRELYRRLV